MILTHTLRIMSSGQATSSLTTLSFCPSDWVNLEVPGEIIDNNWTDEDIRGDARHRAASPSISKDALRIAWKQVEDQSDRDQVKQSKEETFNLIESFDSGGLKCMYAAYQFTRGIKEEYIDYYYDSISGDVDSGYEELCDSLNKKNRRVGKCMFIYLYNKNFLKSIFTLDYIDRLKPREIGQADNPPSNPINDLTVGDIEDVLETSSRDAQEWHSFQYGGSYFLSIKRHYRDAVDTQTTTNEEVEQAEYVVSKFIGDKVEIHTEKKSTAGTVRTSLAGAYHDTDVEFERAEERKPHDHFDRLTPIDLIENIEEVGKYVVTGILTGDSKLTNNPTVKLRTDGGRVLPAIQDLQTTSDQFFTEIRRVKHIAIEKDDTTYTLFPRQDEGNNYEWYVRYQAAGISDTEREEFESDMEEALDISPCFVSSE